MGIRKLGFFLAICLQIFNSTFLIKLYPVLMNSFFLLSFAYTLIKPPSMIEKFARLQHKELSKFAITYTRQVTIIWCVFFILNGLMAAYTVFYTSLKVWTLYNGLISYCLMGLLFAGEYICRIFAMRKDKQNNAN